jgi:integrase
MENNNKPRRGRKEKPYELANGKRINGLRRRKNDGRWVIISTGEMFTEPNEEKAIATFYNKIGKGDPTVKTVFDGENFIQEKTPWGMMVELGQQKKEQNEQEYIDRLISDLLTRPAWLAEKTGFEKLGYLTDLKPPEALPTADELLKLWEAHAKCSKGQKKKVSRAWEDFISVTNIQHIGQITAKVCVDFQDNVFDRELSGKQQQHIFSGIRRMLSFAVQRALAVSASSKALEYLRIMQPNESTKNIDPKPITLADWNDLLKVATGEDKAMMLLMLNAALYAGEVINIKWDDIKPNGTMISRRKKTGEFVRVAVLWEETISALNEIPRKGQYIFTASGGAAKGNPLEKDGAFNRFRSLVKKAEKESNCQIAVTASHLRDGAFTQAVAANVSLPIVNLLVGHSSGMADSYILANPLIVKPACDAIHKHYFPVKKA